jgi:hypothetical protein
LIGHIGKILNASKPKKKNRRQIKDWLISN